MKKHRWVRPLLIAAAFFVLLLIFKKWFMSYPDRIKSVLKKNNIPDRLVPVVIAQAMHESNNFRSNVFLKNNNAFGMGVPVMRKSPYIKSSGTVRPASEGGAPYAAYTSIEMSVKDLLHWHQFNRTDWNSIKSVQGYAAYLKTKSYYADTVNNYTAGMLHWYSQLGLIMPEIVSA